ncbi:MAG: GGDEF domain-containing protein [Elusimicrobiota bacterium]
MWKPLVGFCYEKPRTFHIGLALGLTACLGIVDYFTVPDFSFSVFYLIPVALAARLAGLCAGLLLAAATAGAWLAAALLTKEYSHPLIPYWNAGVRLVFFAITAYALAALKEASRALQREREDARTDPLTGAANRRRFLEAAEAEIRRARRYGHPLSVAFLDIDGFKEVNDRRGHAEGDRLLKEIAQFLRRTARDADLVARLGGDEFAVLLPETDAESAREWGRRVREEIPAAAASAGGATCSVGVASFEPPPPSVEELLLRADELMYEEKRNGKNPPRPDIRAPEGTQRP